MTSREMLEIGIARHFDDVAAHAAYADYLQESGDPRGEYIQLRLLLENENQPVRLLQQARERAARLYNEHVEDWLGSLAPFLLDREHRVAEPASPNVDFTFDRGWLHTMVVHDVREALLMVLGRARSARMLQSLTLVNTRLPNAGQPLAKLLNAPFWDTLKAFTLGDSQAFVATADASGIVELVSQAHQLRSLSVHADGLAATDLVCQLPSALQELSLGMLANVPFQALARHAGLQQLQSLFLSCNIPPPPADEFELAIEVHHDDLREFLAAPQFQRLTHLTIRAQGLGDDGCRVIARSGVLGRLTSLDLRHCNITDEGAILLARSRDINHLKRLDVGGNRLTLVGVHELRETDVTLQWDQQFGEFPDVLPPGDAWA